MKKFLVLMRHGDAANPPSGSSDYERILTPKGDAEVRAQGLVMIGKNIWPDLVLCSSAVRTRQTCDLLRNVWEGDMEPRVENRTDLYQCAPADILKMIRAQDPNLETLMVIGHNPTIHQLAMLLCASGDPKCQRIGNSFPTATLAVFETELRSWAGIAEGGAILRDFITPKK